jgi:hypothetical protein
LTRVIQGKNVSEAQRNRLEKNLVEAEALQEGENTVVGVPFYPVARQRFSHDMAFLYGALALGFSDTTQQDQYIRLSTEHSANVAGVYDRSINEAGSRSPLLAGLVPYTHLHRAIFSRLSTGSQGGFDQSVTEILNILSENTDVHDRYFNAYIRNLPASIYVFDMFVVAQLTEAAVTNEKLRQYLVSQGWKIS